METRMATTAASTMRLAIRTLPRPACSGVGPSPSGGLGYFGVEECASKVAERAGVASCDAAEAMEGSGRTVRIGAAHPATTRPRTEIRPASGSHRAMCTQHHSKGASGQLRVGPADVLFIPGCSDGGRLSALDMRHHQLELDRTGQHSISVNDQWRICFRFVDGDAYDVKITDYH